MNIYSAGSFYKYYCYETIRNLARYGDKAVIAAKNRCEIVLRKHDSIELAICELQERKAALLARQVYADKLSFTQPQIYDMAELDEIELIIYNQRS